VQFRPRPSGFLGEVLLPSAAKVPKRASGGPRETCPSGALHALNGTPASLHSADAENRKACVAYATRISREAPNSLSLRHAEPLIRLMLRYSAASMAIPAGGD